MIFLDLTLKPEDFDLSSKTLPCPDTAKLEIINLSTPLGIIENAEISIADPWLVIRDSNNFVTKFDGCVRQGEVVYKLKESPEGTYFVAWDWDKCKWVAGILDEGTTAIPIQSAFTDSFKKDYPQCHSLGTIGETSSNYRSAAFYDENGGRIFINTNIATALAEAYWRDIHIENQRLLSCLSKVPEESITISQQLGGLICKEKTDVLYLLFARGLLAEHAITELPDYTLLCEAIRKKDFSYIKKLKAEHIFDQAKKISESLISDTDDETSYVTDNRQKQVNTFSATKFSLKRVKSQDSLGNDFYLFDYQLNAITENHQLKIGFEKYTNSQRCIKSISIEFAVVSNNDDIAKNVDNAAQFVLPIEKALACRHEIAVKLAKGLTRENALSNSSGYTLANDELFLNCPSVRMECGIFVKEQTKVFQKGDPKQHLRAIDYLLSKGGNIIDRIGSVIFSERSKIIGKGLNHCRIILAGDPCFIGEQQTDSAREAAEEIATRLKSYSRTIAQDR